MSQRGWPRHLKAVIFDCDGLLLDTQAAWNDAFRTVAASHGVHLNPDKHPELIGASVESAARILSRHFGRPESSNKIAGALARELVANIPSHARLKPGARTIIDSLSKRFKLGVASNSPLDVLRTALQEAGLLTRLDTVVASAEVSASKPAGKVYKEACRRLGVPTSAAVAVEDSLVGVVAARAAGLYVIGVSKSPNGLPADLVVGHLSRVNWSSPASVDARGKEQKCAGDEPAVPARS